MRERRESAQNSDAFTNRDADLEVGDGRCSRDLVSDSGKKVRPCQCRAHVQIQRARDGEVRKALEVATAEGWVKERRTNPAETDGSQDCSAQDDNSVQVAATAAARRHLDGADNHGAHGTDAT